MVVQKYPGCLEGNRKRSGVSSLFLQELTMADLSGCAQAAFGIVKTLYGEIRSSCSTVNSGTLTGIVYVIQVEKPCLCHEGCSLSFLT